MFEQLVTVCDSTSINNLILALKRTPLPVRALPNPWGPQCDKIRLDVSISSNLLIWELRLHNIALSFSLQFKVKS